jgi:hypothetical protein
VLAIGAGFDSQSDLTLAGRPGEDYRSWTIDAFLDHPVGRGAWSVEAAYLHTESSPNGVPFTQLVPGDDHQVAYLQAGYLFPSWSGPGRVQLYGRHERLDVEARPDTAFSSLGVSYLLDGHQQKLTLDWTRVDQDDVSEDAPAARDRNLVTVQVAVGF